MPLPRSYQWHTGRHCPLDLAPRLQSEKFRGGSGATSRVRMETLRGGGSGLRFLDPLHPKMSLLLARSFCSAATKSTSFLSTTTSRNLVCGRPQIGPHQSSNLQSSHPQPRSKTSVVGKSRGGSKLHDVIASPAAGIIAGCR